MSHSEKIKPKQRFKVYDTFMLRAILGSDSTDSQEDPGAAGGAGASTNSGNSSASGGGGINSGGGKNSNSPAAGSQGSSSKGGASGRLASSFCRGGCSRSISSSAVLNNSNYDYGTPATVAPSTSTHSGSGCIACEADKHYQQQHHSGETGERKSRRSFATRSSCSKMSHSSSSSMRSSSRSCMSNSNSKSVSPGSYSCNALNVDFSTYTATHQWTKMLECAEFVGAK